jgi:hypothetical protein
MHATQEGIPDVNLTSGIARENMLVSLGESDENIADVKTAKTACTLSGSWNPGLLR